MANFGSLITAMITPFAANCKGDEALLGDAPIDFAATEKLINHLIETGTDSIVVSGTTGENPTLTHDEEQELFKFVKNKANAIDPNVKILFGTGSNCTRTVLESNREAEALGADGVLIVTPYYNKPNQKGLLAHFNRIASNTSLPIVLYNIPGRCVINMNADTICELIDANPNIVGLKEASNNLDQISEIRQKFDHNRFKIYSGDDSLTLGMMAVGADGVISVASHLAGKQMKDMIDYFVSGKAAEAEAIHKQLFPLFVELFKEPNPTCVKAALEMLGICSSALRQPLVELTAEQKQELKAVMDKALLNPVS